MLPAHVESHFGVVETLVWDEDDVRLLHSDRWPPHRIHVGGEHVLVRAEVLILLVGILLRHASGVVALGVVQASQGGLRQVKGTVEGERGNFRRVLDPVDPVLLAVSGVRNLHGGVAPIHVGLLLSLPILAELVLVGLGELGTRWLVLPASRCLEEFFLTRDHGTVLPSTLFI